MKENQEIGSPFLFVGKFINKKRGCPKRDHFKNLWKFSLQA